MRILIDLGGVVVDHPELDPYFRDAKDVPPKADADNALLRSKILGLATGYVDFAEIVGWQIRATQLGRDATAEWGHYFKRLYDRTPAIRDVVEDESGLLAAETLWLFGVGDPSEPLNELGFERRQ